MSHTKQNNPPWKSWLVRVWLLAATFVYVWLALKQSKPVDWNAPWVPDVHKRSAWFDFAAVAAVLSWADGWLIPWIHRQKAGLPADAMRAYRQAYARFVMRAAMFFAGASCGVSLSFQTHDARYSIVSAGISALMILLLPGPKTPEPNPSAS